VSAASLPRIQPTLEQLITAALARIQVTRPEIAEARRRRDLLAAILRKRFPSCRIYVNGSIAHGDALNPLTDVDLGVVIHDMGGVYGPGQRGPSELQKQAADAIRDELGATYPKLRVELTGRKRSIIIRFGDPVTKGQDDFTADLIIAIDNPEAAGLYIPRFTGWDRSHPEQHTKLVLTALKDTDTDFARVVRLLKHWNKGRSKPLCSWNIKALALGSITGPTELIPGLHQWFTHAVAELSSGETEDPAGVAEKPIKLNVTRTRALEILRKALAQLELAQAYEEQSYLALAHDQLAKVFNDTQMLPGPNQDDVLVEAAAHRREHPSRPVTAVPGVGVSGPVRTPAPPVRSWAP